MTKVANFTYLYTYMVKFYKRPWSAYFYFNLFKLPEECYGIWQVSIPINELTKTMNQIITQYLLSKYIIQSIQELNQIIYAPDIGLAVRVFANGPGSIPGRVIPKTQKMVLDASLLNTQHYEVRIKGKVGQSREGVAPSPTPWCSSYRKGSLRVTLDYGRQLYFTYI